MKRFTNKKVVKNLRGPIKNWTRELFITKPWRYPIRFGGTQLASETGKVLFINALCWLLTKWSRPPKNTTSSAVFAPPPPNVSVWLTFGQRVSDLDQWSLSLVSSRPQWTSRSPAAVEIADLALLDRSLGDINNTIHLCIVESRSSHADEGGRFENLPREAGWFTLVQVNKANRV